MSITTRKCSNPECGEWYDAKASSCYICGDEFREENRALKKANETAALNGALASQMNVLRAEQNAEREIQAARDLGLARVNVPGHKGLVQGIKDSLEEHPEVLDYFADTSKIRRT